MRTSFLYVLLSASIYLPNPAHGQASSDPLRKALDADGDGTISAAEAQEAAYVLQFLDEDGDGVLGPEELARRGGSSSGFGSGMGMGMGGGRNRSAPGPAPSPHDIPTEDGTATIPDRATFLALAYERGMVMPHLKGREFVKFQIEDATSDNPKLYFINTKTHPTHIGFMQASGIAGFGKGMRGVLVYRPFLRSGTGGQGMYTFEFEHEDAYPPARILAAFDLLTASSKLLHGDLAYHPLGGSLKQYQADPKPFEAMDIPLFLPSEEFRDVGFLPLHQATGYGRLRLMSEGEFPGPRDIVIYPTLPNEMPRVAGVLTMVRQTPLSHVNLRAIQDDIPNAFVAGASTSAAVQDLLEKYVRLTVSDSGYVLEEVQAEQVLEFFETTRPEMVSFPKRDLSTAEILALDRIRFEDSARFGVKAANLGSLHSMGLPVDCVPHGFAVPFVFYDEFFRSHGFAEDVEDFLGDPAFQEDAAYRKKILKGFRKRIKQAAMPAHLEAALDDLYATFPSGTSLRCRSSTNNEDLPGFSGAGLYESYTHHPAEGSLSKSI
ncbi:MAG: PEP/pyruvate-binding domain-containing protein, partial [Planctomycetota bacterium]